MFMRATSVHDRGFSSLFFIPVILGVCYVRKLGHGFNYILHHCLMLSVSHPRSSFFWCVYTLRSLVFCTIIRMQPLDMLYVVSLVWAHLQGSGQQSFPVFFMRLEHTQESRSSQEGSAALGQQRSHLCFCIPSFAVSFSQHIRHVSEDTFCRHAVMLLVGCGYLLGTLGSALEKSG